MRRVIWKYPLEVAFGWQVVIVPYGGQFLSAMAQQGGIVVYAAVEPDSPTTDARAVCVCPTGLADLPEEAAEFLGTVAIDSLVFHVFANSQEKEVGQHVQV